MKTTVIFLLVLSCALQASQVIQVAVIAHRGASGYLPEHTLEAVAAAHAMGANYIEQDVVLTKDDVPVVLHDIYLDTVTDVALRFPGRQREDGRFYALDFTLAEIKTLLAHERVDHKTGKPSYPKRFPLGRSTFEVPTLEEELQLIQGLNQSTGRVAGIYPEIKQPAWHRKQGRDISAVVLPVLRKYGYELKTDLCYVQCFEFSEVRRLRGELGWKGRLIFLMSGGSKKGDDGTDFARLRTPEGLAEVAQIADGIGPAISSVIAGKTKAGRQVTTLVKDAHAAKLAVHPYTMRVDELPACVESADDLHHLLFDEAGVDGLFTDFPDVTVHWLDGRK